MITLRPAHQRGHADHGWLDTYYSFSFSDYYDPVHMGFRDLRVINDDRIAGGAGFPTHGHRDMEIITYMIAGALAHQDSTGGEGVIRRGEVQVMTAGKGVRHSEFNASATETAHLLQIWIMPNKNDLTPAYAQKHIPDDDKKNQLRLLVSPKNSDPNNLGEGLSIHQDVFIYASLLNQGASVTHHLNPHRAAWLQMVSGAVLVNDTPMKSGDGAAVDETSMMKITAQENSEFLLFDLA